MPLAHILAPQIAQKSKELEAALGHAPVATGYLEAGYEKTPYDPKGLMNKPDAPRYDPASPVGSYLNTIGTMQRSPNPVQQQLGRALAEGIDAPDRVKKGEAASMLPNAPAPAVQTAPLKKTKRGVAIDLPKTGPVGYDENGQAVDASGKKLGYLNQPAIVTPYGDTPMRTADRREGDVTEADRDPFAMSTIEKNFSKHLAEVEFNNGKFPPGYFKGMKPDEKERIQKGVQLLIKQRREEKKGLPTI